MERRKILKAIAVAVAPALQCTEANAGVAAEENYADPAAADRWMRNWMKQPSAANGMLRVERFADRYYYLTQKIKWQPDDPDSRLPTVTVPVGFVTDFASIPRVAWSLLPPDGNYTYPAVVHDYLYWSQPIMRSDADEIFKLMMYEFGIADRLVTVIHAAVRVGGDSAWSENLRLRKAGERRVLRTFPTDPRTRWTVWKNKDVFASNQ